jgi:Protein of unknown function (DUF2846)
MKSSLKWIINVWRFLFVLTLALTAGCITYPPASLVQPWPTPPPDGYAMLFMYSTQNESGPSFSIDDTEIFRMRGNMYTWVYIRAGKHTFGTKWSTGFGSNKTKKDVTFDAGTNYYTRLLFKVDWNPYWSTIHAGVRQVSEQAAKKDTATCWFRKPLVSQIDDNIMIQPEKN